MYNQIRCIYTVLANPTYEHSVTVAMLSIPHAAAASRQCATLHNAHVYVKAQMDTHARTRVRTWLCNSSSAAAKCKVCT